MPANGQPAYDQLKTLAKGAPSTDARVTVLNSWHMQSEISKGMFYALEIVHEGLNGRLSPCVD
jgi:hypothetical protein